MRDMTKKREVFAMIGFPAPDTSPVAGSFPKTQMFRKNDGGKKTFQQEVYNLLSYRKTKLSRRSWENLSFLAFASFTRMRKLTSPISTMSSHFVE